MPFRVNKSFIDNFLWGNMIKPEDIFNLRSGCFLVLHTLTRAEKYRTQKWELGGYYFYTYMYNKDAISKTTYYVEVM